MGFRRLSENVACNFWNGVTVVCFPCTQGGYRQEQYGYSERNENDPLQVIRKGVQALFMLGTLEAGAEMRAGQSGKYCVHVVNVAFEIFGIESVILDLGEVLAEYLLIKVQKHAL